MTQVLVPIEGMSCSHCVLAVETAAKSVPGVQRVEVSLDRNQAQVEVDDGGDLTAIEAAIVAAGYTVGAMEVK